MSFYGGMYLSVGISLDFWSNSKALGTSMLFGLFEILSAILYPMKPQVAFTNFWITHLDAAVGSTSVGFLHG